MAESEIVGLKLCARNFGVAEKTIRNWIDEGMPIIKKGGRGRNNDYQISQGEAIRWFADRELKKHGISRTGEDAEESNVDYQLKKERLRKEKRNNNREEGKLIEFETDVIILSEVMSLITQELQNMPDTVTQSVKEYIDQSKAANVRDAVRVETRKIRNLSAEKIKSRISEIHDGILEEDT